MLISIWCTDIFLWKPSLVSTGRRQEADIPALWIAWSQKSAIRDHMFSPGTPVALYTRWTEKVGSDIACDLLGLFLIALTYYMAGRGKLFERLSGRKSRNFPPGILLLSLSSPCDVFQKPVKGTGGERFIEGSEFLVSLDSSRLVALGTYWLRYFLFVFLKKKKAKRKHTSFKYRKVATKGKPEYGSASRWQSTEGKLDPQVHSGSGVSMKEICVCLCVYVLAQTEN